jgi:HSP20 family protein
MLTMGLSANQTGNPFKKEDASMLTRRTANTSLTDPFTLFDRFLDPEFIRLGRLSRLDDDLSNRQWVPAVDMRQTQEAYIIEADLPGISKKQLSLTVEDNVLTLSGDRQFENLENKDTYDRVERVYGRFARSFTLPGNVDTQRVAAAFKDGVLTVTIPKLEKAKTRQVDIG